jgi:hypothetical protein
VVEVLLIGHMCNTAYVRGWRRLRARITLDLPGFTAADGSALDAGSTAGEVNGTARGERTEAH